MTDMARANLPSEELSQIVNQMLRKAGLENKDNLTFSDFQTMMAPNIDLLSNVSLEWKGEYCIQTMNNICLYLCDMSSMEMVEQIGTMTVQTMLIYLETLNKYRGTANNCNFHFENQNKLFVVLRHIPYPFNIWASLVSPIETSILKPLHM